MPENWRTVLELWRVDKKIITFEFGWKIEEVSDCVNVTLFRYQDLINNYTDDVGL